MNDKSTELLSRFPGPVKLYPSRKKWLAVFLIGAVFVGGGVLMIQRGDRFGWYVTVFFALVAIVAIVVMLPNASYLTLDRDGFEARNLYRPHRGRWSDTEGFEAQSPLRITQRMVVYDDLTQKSRMLSGINTSLVGRNAGLPDTYGFSAADLAELMARWRERALSPGAGSPGGAASLRP